MQQSETNNVQKESIKWHPFFIISLVLASIVMSAYTLYLNVKQPRFATISVLKVIEHQVKKFDQEMRTLNTVPNEAQRQMDVEKYTSMIAKTIKEYSKKNNLVVFEQGSIVSSGIEIEDMTDDFIKAISE